MFKIFLYKKCKHLYAFVILYQPNESKNNKVVCINFNRNYELYDYCILLLQNVRIVIFNSSVERNNQTNSKTCTLNIFSEASGYLYCSHTHIQTPFSQTFLAYTEINRKLEKLCSFRNLSKVVLVLISSSNSNCESNWFLEVVALICNWRLFLNSSKC